jgi:hypothetical protein
VPNRDKGAGFDRNRKPGRGYGTQQEIPFGEVGAGGSQTRLRVKNVVAAGGCELKTLGVWYSLSEPTIEHDPTRRRFPLFVRMMLGIIGANDFMQLSTSHSR